MVRLRLKMAMDELNKSAGAVTSVAEVFEATDTWSPGLKEAKNAYPTEFHVVSVPAELGLATECLPELNAAPQKSKEKFYATEFREKVAGRNTVVNLLWVEERKYWRVVAISALDASDANITPHVPIAPAVTEAVAEKISGDPRATKDITDFYNLWLARRDVSGAMRYVSARSYRCLPPSADEKTSEEKPSERIRLALYTRPHGTASRSEFVGHDVCRSTGKRACAPDRSR